MNKRTRSIWNGQNHPIENFGAKAGNKSNGCENEICREIASKEQLEKPLMGIQPKRIAAFSCKARSIVVRHQGAVL